MEAVDTEFQDCMAAMVRKFPGSEEARRAEAGETMQDCTRQSDQSKILEISRIFCCAATL